MDRKVAPDSVEFASFILKKGLHASLLLLLICTELFKSIFLSLKVADHTMLVVVVIDL